MRRKINYQTPEYVMNNELICFGLSSHDSEEWKMSWTPQAEKDLAIVRITCLLKLHLKLTLPVIIVEKLVPPDPA